MQLSYLAGTPKCGKAGITPSIGLQQGFRAGLYGGDGFHLVALTGPGRVWLQSMPLPMLAQALSHYLGKEDRGAAVGAGAVGGIIGDILRP